MHKPFDAWYKRKKILHFKESTAFAHAGNIWWCALGINVGVETDGKNEDFERPVLVLRVYNKDAILILPITSSHKNDKFHYEIKTETHNSAWVKMTQIRTISSKRLLRKINQVSREECNKLRAVLKYFL